MRIVINGVGIAGPTLAFFLQLGGHDVLLVEEAPELRTGGYMIDFWGVGYDIVERMGLLPQVKALGYQVQEVRFVDRDGRRTGGFSTGVFGRLTKGRFTSLRRSDLATLIYRALDGTVETRFGDSIVEIEESPDRVRVAFARAAARDVDLVIGADGLHSTVRHIVFGPETAFEVSLGYHVAAFEIEGYRPRDELVYVSHAVPGRQISRFAMRNDRTLFLFMFRDEYLPAARSQRGHDRQTLAEVFADVGWECPLILDAMKDIDDIYFDHVSQIRMAHWTRGRTALVGDAAACVSLLAGEGTGLAIAEAYVLAGELTACHGNYQEAFARYEARLTQFLARKQRSAARLASSFVPKSGVGLAFRNLVFELMRVPAIADYFVGRDLRDEVVLPRYRW